MNDDGGLGRSTEESAWARITQDDTKEFIPFREAVVTLYDCYTAEEAFLTGTAAEVIPMVKLDGREIGDGKPGPVATRLRQLYIERGERDAI